MAQQGGTGGWRSSNRATRWRSKCGIFTYWVRGFPKFFACNMGLEQIASIRGSLRRPFFMGLRFDLRFLQVAFASHVEQRMVVFMIAI